MDYLSFGSITVPVKWFILAVALLLSYFLLKLHKNPSFSSAAFDGISNSLMVGLLILKLSLLLTEPALVVKNLLSLLYFTGGELGFWLAVAGSIAFFFWETKKKNVTNSEQVAVSFYYILYSYTIYFIASLFFTPGWEPVLKLLFSVVVLIWLSFARSRISITSVSIAFALYQIILANIFQKTGNYLSYEHVFYAFFIVMILFEKRKTK